MRCIISKTNNPYLNLATEEFFLKSSNEEIFMLYVNEPCVVVGKHQNLLSEINLPYVIENKIKPARRLSGGGTVYQDLNNLNFSFIHNCSNLDQMNFSRFTAPVLEALRAMGLPAEFSGRNDLLLEGYKISGNAMHISKNRVLSHGTLLFNSDLKNLSAALLIHPDKYICKSIKSVRSKVTNISNYLGHSVSLDQFSHHLFQLIIQSAANPYIKQVDDTESKSINQIAKEKFETWEWIYGYSPRYEFQNNIFLLNGSVGFKLIVEKGIIIKTVVNIDSDDNLIYLLAIESLKDVKHDYKIIQDLLISNNKFNSHPTFNLSEFCSHLF